MDIRYGANPKDAKHYTTQQLREEFLIEELYRPDEVVPVYSHIDRMLVMGIMPVSKPLAIEEGIDVWSCFGTKFVMERREAGLFNLGGAGAVTVDGTRYELGYKDCLYISMGSREVSFESTETKQPARFYLISAPAHKPCPTTLIRIEQAAKKPLGAMATANERVINQFIHPDVLETCQLCMGLTELSEGSVWNTMPAHTHERRMEIYTYFELPQDHVVFHMMGQGQETRHIVMQNGQAVISPSWSIHSGCGTARYAFIWAMGGENKEFDDMDVIGTQELR